MNTRTAQTRNQRGAAEWILIALEILLAASAYVGAVGLISGGLDLGGDVATLPLQSPVLAGVALAVVNGLLPTVVVIAAILGRPWSDVGHVVVGTALVTWIVIQVALIGPASPLQLVYLVYGLAILVLGVSVASPERSAR